jgi:hypothetical protein
MPGVVLEPGGEPECARLHALCHALAHLLDLSGVRVTAEVVLAHRVAAQVPVPDEARDVDRDRRLLHALEEVAHRIGHRAVLADDDRRHALAHDGLRSRHLEEALVVMAVHVDEPGREHEALCIDHRLAALRLEVPDFRDAVAVDANGARARRAPGAVDDRRIDDERRRNFFLSTGSNANNERRGERGAGKPGMNHSEDSFTRWNGMPRSPEDQ